MLMREIVIKIPEEEYQKYIKMRPAYPDGVFCLIKEIQNGTPLPEGHGRLIDADALLQKHQDFDAYPFPSITIHNAPTIIEGSDSE
jgi:hypothetical protein